jgi:hypothetical protein
MRKHHEMGFAAVAAILSIGIGGGKIIAAAILSGEKKEE